MNLQHRKLKKYLTKGDNKTNKTLLLLPSDTKNIPEFICWKEL